MKTYSKKPATKKMQKYIDQVTKRIAEDEFNGIFTTDQIISDSGFVDFLFIGEYKGRPVVWNACITTAKGDFYNHVYDIAVEEAYEKYPNPEDYDWKNNFVECEVNGAIYLEYIEKNPELLNKRYRYAAERAMELFNAKVEKLPPCNIEIDREYRYGIGLHVRINIESINVSDIYTFIEGFQKHGEELFEQMGVDCAAKSWNAEELGIELKGDNIFISWIDKNRPHDVEEIKI